MTVRAAQGTIGGGSVVTISRPWTSEERSSLGRDRKLPANAAFRRLCQRNRETLEGIERAGSIEAYYSSGGAQGPFGGKTRKAPVRKVAPAPEVDWRESPTLTEDRIAQLERELSEARRIRVRHVLRKGIEAMAHD